MIPQYGKDKPYQGKETDFQKSSFQLVQFFGLPLAYHTANESRRPGRAGDIERMQNKLQGVLSGVSDWCIPHRTKTGHPGAYIELKTKGGKLSRDQVAFLEGASAEGYFCAVVWNLDAMNEVLETLYGKNQHQWTPQK